MSSINKSIISVPTWYTNTPEKKPYKRHGRGGEHEETRKIRPKSSKDLSQVADIYPQEPKQDEDVMDAQRLKNGYQIKPVIYEHESWFFGQKKPPMDKVDMSITNASGLFMHLLNRKSENAVQCLDKDRKKSKEVCTYQAAASMKTELQYKFSSIKDKTRFFAELMRGMPLQQLAKKSPLFQRREDILMYLYEFKIDANRAWWYLKMFGCIQQYMNPPTKNRKTSSDAAIMDYMYILCTKLRDLIHEIGVHSKNSEVCEDKRRQWKYVCYLGKHGFEEGCIDRHEYLNALCNIFTEIFIQNDSGVLDGWMQLRIFMLYFASFGERYAQSYLLGRRAAYIISQKLGMIKEGWDSEKGVTIPGGAAFEEMVKCGHKRHALFLMFQMLQCLCIEIPAAMVWNRFILSPDRAPYIFSQVCGSPLDNLPCALHELPMHKFDDKENFIELLKMRSTEIVRRSLATEAKWAFNQRHQEYYAQLIETSLNVLGTLDSINCLGLDAIEKITQGLFAHSKQTTDFEMSIRIRLVLQWAVTIQREGTHRAIIVAKVLTHQSRKQGSSNFGNRSLQELILEYVEVEGPKPGEPNFTDEFSNLILLFIELIRMGVFSHDIFVKNLIKNDEVNHQNPIMKKLVTTLGLLNNSSGNGNGNGIGTTDVRTENVKEELNTSGGGGVDLTGTSSDLCRLPLPKPDQHILLEETQISNNERLLLQVPLPPIEEFSSERNQRSMILWGIEEEREKVLDSLRAISSNISKIWTRRVVALIQEVEETKNWEEAEQGIIDYKRPTPARAFDEQLGKFYALTYHDQVIVAAICSESFLDVLKDFIKNKNGQVPVQEAIDVVCHMYEHSMYIYGIFEFLERLSPLLIEVERVVYGCAMDVIPGSVSCQLAAVCVGYLSRHWQYFLHSDHAPNIVNGLYRLVEREIRARDSPITCWARSIAVFVYHARQQLKKGKLTDQKILGGNADFSHIFFHGNSGGSPAAKYNSNFFQDLFELNGEQFLFMSYHEFKKRLPTFDNPSNRYSFVVNAIKTAAKFGMEYAMINHLACMCATITAQKPLLADEWIGAARALCCSSVSSHHGYGELFMELNVSDCSLHYPIATFFTLLASKYAYSVPKLVAELLNQVFPAVMKKEHGKGSERSRDHDSEPGVCLALLLISQLVCADDEPLKYSHHYHGQVINEKTSYRGWSEMGFLNLIHWNEMDRVFFPMLANICILVDTLRGRMKDERVELPTNNETTTYRPEYLVTIVKKVQTIVCEQPWVTEKMFQVVTTNNMEAFNSERLKQNCLGQQLLRLGLRRRCERNVVEQLSVCNGNSKKALIDRLLQLMNLWNFRATYFDLVLMIKEQDPDFSVTGQQQTTRKNKQISPEVAPKHAQQGAIAADALLGEVGKCCRDLFVFAHRNDETLPIAKIGSEFRLNEISNFWLLSHLVKLCPTPMNVPSSFPSTTVPAKFLKETATMLDTVNDNSKERILQSAWLLSQQPFLQLVITCLKTDREGNKDGLINALYKQMNDPMQKIKENPALCSSESFQAEREGMLLRLTLIGRLFKEVCSASQADSWCLLLFYMLLYGVVSPDKEPILFESVYDMIGNLIVWALTDKSAIQTVAYGPNQEFPETKFRFPIYMSMFKKLKKAASSVDACKHYHKDGSCDRERKPLQCLAHFLAFPKQNIELTLMEPWGTPPQPPVKVKGSKTVTPPPPNISVVEKKRGKYYVQIGALLQPNKRIRMSPYDFTPFFLHETRGWNWVMFMGTKLDRFPVPVQKLIESMLPHRHQTEYARPNYVQVDHDPMNDPFLSSPTVDITNEQLPQTTKALPAPQNTAAMGMRPPGLIKKEDDDKQQQHQQHVFNPMMGAPQPMGMVHPLAHPGMGPMGMHRGHHHPGLHAPPDSQMGHHGMSMHPSTSAPTHQPPEMIIDTKPNVRGGPGSGRGRRKSAQRGGAAAAGGGQPRQKKAAMAAAGSNLSTSTPPIQPSAQPNAQSSFYQNPNAVWPGNQVPPPSYTSAGAPNVQQGPKDETKAKVRNLISQRQTDSSSNSQGGLGGGAFNGNPSSNNPPTSTPQNPTVSALQTAIQSNSISPVPPNVGSNYGGSQERYGAQSGQHLAMERQGSMDGEMGRSRSMTPSTLRLNQPTHNQSSTNNSPYPNAASAQQQQHQPPNPQQAMNTGGYGTAHARMGYQQQQQQQMGHIQQGGQMGGPQMGQMTQQQQQDYYMQQQRMGQYGAGTQSNPQQIQQMQQMQGNRMPYPQQGQMISGWQGQQYNQHQYQQ